jgi:hypothetical protein
MTVYTNLAAGAQNGGCYPMLVTWGPDGGPYNLASSTNPLPVQFTAAVASVSALINDALGNPIDAFTTGDYNTSLKVAVNGSTPQSTTGAANSAVTITYAAVAGQRHRLTSLSVYYSGASTAQTLTVQDGGTTMLSVPIPANQNTLLNIPLPDGGIQGSVNSAMTVTLPAAGAAVTGTVNSAKMTA